MHLEIHRAFLVAVENDVAAILRHGRAHARFDQFLDLVDDLLLVFRIALRLFRGYAEDQARRQAYGELAREASGLTQLYARQAGLKLLSAKKLELATGDTSAAFADGTGSTCCDGAGSEASRSHATLAKVS